MITEKEYLKAKSIVDAYNEQLRAAEVIRRNELLEKQKKKEEECEEHYFLDDGKWTSTQSCIFCGKKI